MKLTDMLKVLADHKWRQKKTTGREENCRTRWEYEHVGWRDPRRLALPFSGGKNFIWLHDHISSHSLCSCTTAPTFVRLYYIVVCSSFHCRNLCGRNAETWWVDCFCEEWSSIGPLLYLHCYNRWPDDILNTVTNFSGFDWSDWWKHFGLGI